VGSSSALAECDDRVTKAAAAATASATSAAQAVCEVKTEQLQTRSAGVQAKCDLDMQQARVEAQTQALALREKEAVWEKKVLELAGSVDSAQSNLAQCQAKLSEETAAHSRAVNASAAAAAAAADKLLQVETEWERDKLLQAETQRERDLLRAQSVLDLLAFQVVRVAQQNPLCADVRS